MVKMQTKILALKLFLYAFPFYVKKKKTLFPFSQIKVLGYRKRQT